MKIYRTFFVLILFALLSACSKSPVERLKGEMLSGCLYEGGLKDICACAVNRSIKNASPALLKSMEVANPSDEMREEIIDFVYQQAAACKQKLYP